MIASLEAQGNNAYIRNAMLKMWTIQSEFGGIIILMFLLWLELLPLCMIFYLCSYSDLIFFLFSFLEEGRRTYRPKRSGNNNKDQDNSPKNVHDKNQQSSSQKFRQLMISLV